MQHQHSTILETLIEREDERRAPADLKKTSPGLSEAIEMTQEKMRKAFAEPRKKGVRIKLKLNA